MELDMYGEKVADAAQLIRELTGGKEWFHEFDRNTQHTLELFIAAMDKVKADILDSLPSTAGQAPVREVPEGWKLIRCEDGTIIVSKNNIGGYAAWKDDSNIASSILYHFADEFLATVPAAPVQTETKP